MEQYDSSFGRIELTDERLRHIVSFHPEVRSAVKHFAKCLTEPDFIKPSRRDNSVVIFYRAISSKRRLAIVVKITVPRFILTAYFITNLKLDHENKN